MIKKKTKLTILRTFTDFIVKFTNKFDKKIQKVIKSSIFNFILIFNYQVFSYI